MDILYLCILLFEFQIFLKRKRIDTEGNIKSESCVSEVNTSFSTAQRKESVFRFSTSDAETAET